MHNKYRVWIFLLLVSGISSFILFGCKQKNNENKEQLIIGFNFFNRLPGLWHGPVSSSTTAGNFDMWYSDFRPVSPGQVSQFSLLDTITSNTFSFFIVKFNDQLSIAMRTEGCHNDTCCVTYEVLDSAVESEGYYHFRDFVRGNKRACTEFKFTGDEMKVTTWTNKFNKSDTLVWHSTWTATLGSSNSASGAIAHFKYPQAIMTKDFTNAFSNMNESIFFNFANDPYSSTSQPYVGSITANISIAGNLPVTGTDQVFLVFTTNPLFNGIAYIADNLKYISRYVLLSANTKNYKIRSVHPGNYYVYALVDKNHDGTFQSGDYMSSNISNSFVVPEDQNVNIYANIDFIIP